jgi:alpha-beta hydrolase superfamily lysophospholipase
MTRDVRQSTFTASDGERLVYRCWPAEGDPRGAVVLLHRGHEHGGRMAHLADELDLPEHTIFAWDARGHGQSPGRRGHAPSFATLVDDLDRFVAHVREVHGIATPNVAIVAQSVGAVVAAAWVHDHAPVIRALVLASPAFRVRLYVPLARPGLALLRRLTGPFDVQSYVRPHLLTHDAERAASYDADPLVTRPISVDLLLELAAAGDRLVADAPAITTPTMLLISGADAVVEHGPQHAFFVGLGSATKERHVLDGFFHDTLGERDRGPVVADVRRFLLERFAAPVETHDWRDADRRSFTRDELETLRTPLPRFGLQTVRWSIVRGALALGAQWSEGLALGFAEGFDSGGSLDYVYRNEARGWGPIGRLIDRLYLDQAGWRGIRERKELVEQVLVETLDRLATEGQPRVVLDVAAGLGRYVLDAMATSPVAVDHVVLRDQAVPNARAARLLVDQRGLHDTVRFQVADAFDPSTLADLDPRPTLSIVSGLYELYPDNASIRASLAGLAAALPSGGYLITTCQPWHPQLALIARALTSHLGGGSWVMRRRTQAEMDQLVAEAGFEKIAQKVERQGIFTVSLSRRR